MRFKPVTVLLTVLSIVIAGAIARYRDSAITNVAVKAEVGQPVEISDGQTITVREVQLAQVATSPEGKGTRVTTGVLVAVQLELVTPGEPTWGLVMCRLRRPRLMTDERGNTSDVISGETRPIDASVYFPSPGVMRTVWVLIETTPTDLAGAQFVCTPTQTLVFVSREPVFDLGLTNANTPGLLARARNRALLVPKAQDVGI